MDFHVAGAFELFVDHVVHAAAGLDKAGGEDGHAAALLGVSGRAEETLGRVEGDGVDAAGEGASTGGKSEVVGSREAGDAVKKDGDVVSGLDQALGALEHHLGNAAMVFDRLVEGGAVHLSADGAAHVGDLFGALADERDHDPHVGMVGGDAFGDLL